MTATRQEQNDTATTRVEPREKKKEARGKRLGYIWRRANANWEADESERIQTYQELNRTRLNGCPKTFGTEFELVATFPLRRTSKKRQNKTETKKEKKKKKGKGKGKRKRKER